MKKFFMSILLIFSLLILPHFGEILFAESPDQTSPITQHHTNFCIINENDFYMLNTQTNEIDHFKNGAISSSSLNLSTTIEKFLVLKNGNFAVLDNMKHLHFFNNNFIKINSITTIISLNNDQTTYLRVEKVSSMVSDIYSNVYLIDPENNFVLKVNQNSENFEIVLTTPLTEKAKLTFLNSTSEIIISDGTTLQNQTSSITLSAEPLEIFSDAKNFVYLVYENSIEKYKNLEKIDAKTDISNGSNYSINLENGTIYYVLNNIVQTLSNFASNVENFEAPVNDKTKTALTTLVEIAFLEADTVILSNPFSSNVVASIKSQQSVIILANSDVVETDFCYVMTTNNNSTILGYVQEKFLSIKTFDATNRSQVPIRKDISVYKYPNLNSDYCLETLDSTKDYLEITSFNFNGTDFSALKIENNVVYANSNDLIDASNHYISTFLITNATISPYNNQSIIIYSNEEKSSELLLLNSKTNVKLIKTNAQTNMAEIEILQNNEIIHGFIETKFILPQNDFSIPLAIILSLICLITISIIIFKVKKDKLKQPFNKS